MSHRLARASSFVFLGALGAASAAACGSSDATGSGAGDASGFGGSGNGGASSHGSSQQAPASTGANLQASTGTGSGCAPGDKCDHGAGVCDASGTCCPTAQSCGTTCCDAGDVCSFGACATPGAVCQDDKECGAAEFCDFSLGATDGGGGGGSGGNSGGGGGQQCIGGTSAPSGKCVPKPPVCPGGMAPGDPPTCVTSCEYHPPLGVFTPELKYAWGDPTKTTDNVMMTPIVVQLDDDNCDGVIDDKDIPEIVFFTFDNNDYNNTAGTSAVLHAISIVGGVVKEKFATRTPGDAPGRSIAAGDLDGDGKNDIVVCTTDGRLRAYSGDGVVKWTGAVSGCFMPSIADLDQDGHPEVVDQGIVLDGATGQTKATFPASEYIILSDVDGDGELDIVTPTKVYGKDGTLKVDSGLTATHVAVGDLDNDGVPEIISVATATHSIHVWHVTGPGTFEIVRQDLDINEGIATNPCCVANPASAGCTRGGGTPTIARFNDDAFPDVGVAGGIGYVVFDGKKLMDTATPAADVRAWLTLTQDCSSAQTGSSVFDFDGDGVAEVVYGDELTLHIYDGRTGTPLFETCNTNGTLWEYPVIADVDNDGHADIVVASNSYSGFNCSGTKTTGIRIFGDHEGKWVRTRRVWNQHAYHVTNVAESGAIPTIEAANYLTPGLNNFRQNVQPSGQFSAPDLVVTIEPVCMGTYGLRARVLNVGEAAVEPGVPVGFYKGSAAGTKLGERATTRTLYPLTYEDVVLPLPQAPMGDVVAVADDGMPPHPWHECRTDNNVSAAVAAACETPH